METSSFCKQVVVEYSYLLFGLFRLTAVTIVLPTPTECHSFAIVDDPHLAKEVAKKTGRSHIKIIDSYYN